MKNTENLLRCVELPCFYKVRCNFSRDTVGDIKKTLLEALNRKGTLDRVKKGESVCITAGSREISNFCVILKALIEALTEKGAKPFIIPAMGSHGGATAEGQKEIIAQFGITEENMGVPVLSSMETAEIGCTGNGITVHVDEIALTADHILPVGRIKPHTDFKGTYESGLMKMLAIGLGKQHGASTCHKLGMANMSKNVMAIGKKVIETCSIPFGIGIIENAFHGTYKIAAIPGEDIEAEEPELLKEAKSLMPVIPFEKVDVIICEEMGKDISGTGMDSNVIGRSASLGVSRPFAERIGVFSLTEKSHGNANGMGLADAVTRRFYRAIDFDQTYPNAITSAETTAVKLPAVMETDEFCVKFIFKTCTGCGENGLRVVWIKNTLSLDEFHISEGLLKEAQSDPAMQVFGERYRACFDEKGGFNKFKPEGDF
ncbi:MAG: lactate racemase domain-containing protein [Eubacteriales bacterium]|nr:lactate racemase domain-containing protein [Eubacteriales bacterium]